MTYQESWAPQNIDQAMFLIDTARDGDRFWAEGEAAAADVMRQAPAECKTVVDYGCGVGRVIGAVEASDPVGVDVSEEMLALARDRFSHVEFRVCDGRSIPLPDNDACFVFSMLALQHMDAADVTAVVKDTERVLRPGGRCYLRFSGFGQKWTPDATLTRGRLQWPGSRSGAMSPAHGAIAYTPEVVEMVAAVARLHILNIDHLVFDAYHHDWALHAEKKPCAS